MKKPLDLKKPLHMKKGLCHYLASNDKGQMHFQTPNGNVVTTDRFGFVGEKQIVFDEPVPVFGARTTHKFKTGQKVWMLRFTANENHFVPCEFIDVAENGTFNLKPLKPFKVRGAFLNKDSYRAIASNVFASPTEAFDAVQRVLDSICAYMDTSANPKLHHEVRI